MEIIELFKIIDQNSRQWIWTYYLYAYTIFLPIEVPLLQSCQKSENQKYQKDKHWYSKIKHEMTVIGTRS